MIMCTFNIPNSFYHDYFKLIIVHIKLSFLETNENTKHIIFKLTISI